MHVNRLWCTHIHKINTDINFLKKREQAQLVFCLSQQRLEPQGLSDAQASSPGVNDYRGTSLIGGKQKTACLWFSFLFVFKRWNVCTLPRMIPILVTDRRMETISVICSSFVPATVLKHSSENNLWKKGYVQVIAHLTGTQSTGWPRQ